MNIYVVKSPQNENKLCKTKEGINKCVLSLVDKFLSNDKSNNYMGSIYIEKITVPDNSKLDFEFDKVKEKKPRIKKTPSEKYTKFTEDIQKLEEKLNKKIQMFEKFKQKLN